MAEKNKNSQLNIHYSRTMTTDNLSKAANYVGGYVLRGLGALGKIMTAPLTGGPLGPATVVLPKTKKLLDAERKLRETQEELIGKAMTWVSPLNYGTALWNGHGLDARKGEEEVSSWSPAWQAVGRLGELYVGPKAVKGVKSAPRAVVNTAAKAGVKPAKAAVVAREIKHGIKLNTKNGRIEITGNYFNSPDKWYRITETPEKYGIMELNKNITTHDASQTYGTINGWRSSMLKAPITKSSEGFIKRPQKIELSIRRKNGQAHGNTSQAAKGKLWGGTTSGSNLFPEGVIEGQAPSMINYGIDRTNFVITPWELVPNGGRVGFHTGEMPMSNLGWFLKTNKGTYTYEPIIPEKRINFTPTKLLEPSKTSSTIQISPEELYKVLKDQELNGYYFMGHGTGRSNVNPQIIFDNGLRIKNGDIGNTTSPISLSSLSLWPHANSKEVIILPGRAENVKFDSARGRIPSDWYDSKTFQWNDNPGFEGSGLFAVLKPNATFVETEINGVPGVYTKPEAILGSYNIDTHTLKLNPRSLYEFLFNVPKLAEPRTSLAFFERKPAKNNIVGASYDYRMEDPKGSMDFLKQFFALLKINGKEYTLEGLRDAANVQQGLPEHIQSYLNLNTVERAVRAMRKNGYSEREIQLYIDKVNEEMNKVKVGMYSDLEYNAAGALDFEGFYNNESNFISVNRDAHLKDSKFTPEYIMKHEGRHLIDYNTSMTDDVINILEKAYDKDFLEIPKHEDAGSLKDYQHMDRERVTTNRDARDVLLTSKGKYLLNKHDFIIDSSKRGYSTDMIDFLNKIIKYALPEDIVNAVENSNGYGKRYINYLKKNNKLTPAKIEQLRLAMIHVPSYLLPIAGGYTLYNLFNQPLQQLQYLKQGGKMNILEFLKNGSGIHIKKENRGKFTDYCGGKVTDECIRRGKNSSSATIRKRATFAANARKWKHLNGGNIIKSLTGLKTASLVKDRYKNGINYSYKLNASPWGYSIISGTLTDKPFMNQGGIGRNISYLLDGTPVDTTYFETPPSLLPVKRQTRSAKRKVYFDKPYIGDSVLYKALLRRYNEAREINSHKNGGTLRFLLLGGDTRSDTTRKGYHEGTVPWGAVDASNTGGLFDLLNYNITSNPNIITGEPTLLPGNVSTLEKEAPTMFKLISEAPDKIRKIMGGWRMSNGETYWSTLGNQIRNFFKTGDKNLLKELESWAKENLYKIYEKWDTPDPVPMGFTKGNEVTSSPMRNLSEEGLSVRTQQPFTPSNYTANPAEKAAAKDFKELYPNSGYKLETQLKTGRPSGDYMYPEEIQQKYKIGKYKPTTKKVKPEKVKSKTAKVTLSERYLDKKNYSKTLRLKDKYARNMEYGDNRITNSGNSRFSKIHRENKLRLMREVYPYKSLVEALEKKMVKYDKNSFGYKQARKKLDDLIDDFNNKFGYKKDGGILLFLLEGGLIKKALDGTKLTNNLGSTLLDIGKNYLLYQGLKNKVSSNTELALAGVDMDYNTALKEANQLVNNETSLILGAMDYLYKTGLSKDNSANSSIFQQTLKNKLLSYKLPFLKQEKEKKKKLINAQAQSLMNLILSDFWMGTANTGLQALISSVGNNVTTPTTDNYQGMNYTPYSYMT